MRPVLVLLASIALLLGACGSEDETAGSTVDDGQSSTEDTASAESPTDDTGGQDVAGDTGDAAEPDDEPEPQTPEADTEAGTGAEDAARLGTALDAIEADARARGYTTERAPSDDDDDLEFQSAECQEADDVLNSLEDQFPETATSDELTASRGELTSPSSVSEELTVELSSFADAESVRQPFAALRSVPLADCMREAFQAEADADADADIEITIESAEVTDGDHGDDELAISIRATFSSAGFSFPVDLQFSFVGVGRDVMFFGAFTFNSSLSDDARALLDSAVGALGG